MQEAENKKKDLVQTVEIYKKSLEVLQSIKRVYKKDGSNFQNLLKNFETPEGVYISRYYVITSKYLQVNSYPLPKIMLEYHNISDEPTAEEIEAEIKLHIEKYTKRIKEAENNLAKFNGELEQLSKITEKLGEFLDGLQSGNDYKLRDLLKKAL